MILSNLNNLSIIIFILLLIFGVIIVFLMYKNTKNKLLGFLFISFLFLIINIFEIKGGLNNNIQNVEGGKVVFAIDVSKSMLAEDVLSGNNVISRLEGIKGLINNYIINNIYNLYGLIVFAGESIEALPFTDDIGIFKTVLYGVNNNNISVYGTNLNSVFSSIESYFISEKEGGLAVIFTDGGDENIIINKDIINNLKKINVEILLVGIGSVNGSKIPEGQDFFGRTLYKQYLGEEVITKLNSEILDKLSTEYNIDYISLDNVNDFNKVNSYITKNINLLSLEKNINNRTDYTRALIFISLIFFILFLITDFILGRKI